MSTARLCVPFTAPLRRDVVYQGVDVTARLRLFLDAYELGGPDRAAFTEVLNEWATDEGKRWIAVKRDWIGAVPTDVATRPRAQQITTSQHL